MSLRISVPDVQFENFVDVLPALGFDFTSKNLKNTGVGSKIKELNFSRGSIAYRTNESGLLESVSVNTPRFEYDPITLKLKGLLVEGSSQNELVQSEEYTATSWSKQNITLGEKVASPDGNLTATKLLSNATASSYSRMRQVAGAVTAGKFVTASCYLKKAEFSTVILQVSDVRENGYIKYNFDTGVVNEIGNGVFNYTVEDAPNGFKKLSVTVKATAAGSPAFDILISNNLGAIFYEADGEKGVYAWGCQMEIDKPFSTSYIKTAALKATRSAENLSATATQDIGLNCVGLYAEYYTKHLSSELLEFLVQVGAGTNRVALGFKNGAILTSRKNGGATTILGSSALDNVNKLNKIFAQRVLGTLAISVNGSLNSSASSDFPLNLRNIRIGSQDTASPYPEVGAFFGVIKSVSIIEVALTDDTIRSKTS